MRCGDCGASFELSKRNEYGWRSRGLEPRCEWCRRPPKPVTEADRRWWLERFSHEEIQGMAAAIWPTER